ncbi:MAG: hypothetical protein ACFFBD_26545, partial [Candidatus Hodarchaeota archaeon]
MANRKWHMITSILIFIIYCVVYWYLDLNRLTGSDLPDLVPLLMVTGLFMALIGAEVPDLDLVLSWLQHRDISTHSALWPVIISGTFLLQKLFTPPDSSLVLALVLTPFLLGFSSHLLLDLFPYVDYEEEGKKGITHITAMLLGGFISGLTGLELIKALKGTYLIHLPFKTPMPSEMKSSSWELRKTLPLHLTRWWLFFNG